jgi:hypothetical protein
MSRHIWKANRQFQDYGLSGDLDPDEVAELGWWTK